MSSFTLARTFHFPPLSPPKTKRPKRATPHRASAATKFAGVAGKSDWRQAADAAVEFLLARLDTLATDLIQRPAMRRFGLTFDQWIDLLQMISHALFPEVFAPKGGTASHEGLVPPKAGREAFPLTPRRLAILLDLMRSWDGRGEWDHGDEAEET